jgi:hypothetical protein
MADPDLPTPPARTELMVGVAGLTGTRVSLSLTQELHDSLPPIQLALSGGGFSLYEYVTPESADKLADALRWFAHQARARARAVEPVA